MGAEPNQGESVRPRDGVAVRTRRLFGRGSNVDRVAYYSDAVYAIAMTLLVLDLKIPDGSTSAMQVIQEEWQAYFAFVLSFVIIAYSWISHHRRFRYVIGYDTGLLVINLVLLFFVISLPFPTALVSRFAPETSAVIVYAAAVALLELAEFAEWAYLKRRGLLSPEVDSGVFWYVAWDILPAVLVFGGSIVIALVAGGHIAMLSWFAMFVVAPVAGIIIGRRIDRARRD